MPAKNSRYSDAELASHTGEDGREIAYIRRRFIPRGADHAVLAEVPVEDGDRLDRLTARTLGDPTQYWRLCDANDALHPDELTEEVGQRVRIPIPGGER